MVSKIVQQVRGKISQEQESRGKRDNAEEETEDDKYGNASGKFGHAGSRTNKSKIKGVETSEQRIINKQSKIKDATNNTPNDLLKRAQVEIDTRSDTMSAGSTFKLHESIS